MQMLFYEHAVPVNSRKHAGCSVEASGFAFCRGVNSVPLTAAEFRSVAGEYPIVFAVGGEGAQPVVVLGLRNEENLFVSAQGQWLGGYIPAFVRRYPFVFSMGGADDGRFTLCVDEAFPGFNREGRGEPLFTPGGEPSPYLGKVLRFLQDYRAQFLRTRAFSRRLQQLELLEPMQARVRQGDAKLALGGFSAVSRERLKALPAEALAQLAASDELELIYLHLQSLRDFEALRSRLPALPQVAHQPPAPAPSTAGSRQSVTFH